MSNFVSNINAIIIEAEPIPDSTNNSENTKIENIIGKCVVLDEPIFQDDKPLTKWIENFYQESVSINAKARDDLKEVGVNAFKNPPAPPGFQPWGHTDREMIPEKD